MQFAFDKDGNMRAVDNPLIADMNLGAGEKRRASHVVPTNHLLRGAFYVLRRWFGETGRVAGFTRRWPCRWTVNLTPVGGTLIGPFYSRDAAIAYEVAWVERHVL